MNVDFIVIGAGIAGASVAYELARHADVVVLEAESQPGYHSTGRSAALFSEIYGNATVRALSRASRAFLHEPPASFVDQPLLKARPTLFVGHASERDKFEDLRREPDVAALTHAVPSNEVRDFVSILRPEWTRHAFIEPGSHDIDVHGLHQGYLRGMKARGATLRCSASVTSITRASSGWSVIAGDSVFCAPVIVNAAGAWADEVAVLAGVQRIGLEPRRRTALLVDAPAGLVVDAWPMVIDVAETFYFKPDAGKLLLSPADETPSTPMDVQPDDFDVAVAVDRVEQATTMTIAHVRHRWAGLRSFVRDRSPVIGYEPSEPGFFWLAGQGGYGIQTAPAVARLAAALALRAPLADDEQIECVVPVSPSRLR